MLNARKRGACLDSLQLTIQNILANSPFKIQAFTLRDLSSFTREGGEWF